MWSNRYTMVLVGAILVATGATHSEAAPITSNTALAVGEAGFTPREIIFPGS